MSFDLGRFVEAQDRVSNRSDASGGMVASAVTGCRFVFPRLSGLRPSAMAQRYALASEPEVVTALLLSHAA
jgi:uncharacterized protein (DUF1810 family)